MAGDPRIRALVAEQQHRPEALIEVLHRLQALDGCLPKESLRQVAQELGLPLGRVFGVASFYHLFRLEPPRPHRCAVCLGGSAKGAPWAPGPARAHQAAGLASISAGSKADGRPEVDDRNQEPLDRAPLSPERLSQEAWGQGAWSLEPVSCLGACGQAPVLVVDGVLALRLPIGSALALEDRLDRLGLPRAPGPLATGGI